MTEMMPSLFPEQTLQRIENAGVIAVLVIDQPDRIVPLCRALLACGLDVIELTLRTPAAIEALRLVRQEVPEMLAGVGTILRPDQVESVAEAGAAFGVAPGLNPKVVSRAIEVGLPFAPGITTPTDIEAAIELGCRELKFFPAEASGGAPALKAIGAPLPQITFCPTGGVSPANARDYLSLSNVACAGGSWVAPKQMVLDQDWVGIETLAREASKLMD